LWLNEGFASYIEYLAVDHMFPEWEMWTEFVAGDMGSALSLDSLKHTHAIEIPVHHPDEISEIFDAVSYSKGASVIRMLAEYLGEKDFRDGLRYYLKKHSYKNTVTEDLWAALEKVSRKPVTKMMRAWTRKPGHPVVSLSRTDGKIALKQERFFRSPASKKEANDRTVWQVPVALIGVGQEGVQKYMLDKKSARIETKFQEGWVKANGGETSVVRINYSPELWKLLESPVLKNELSPEDRLGLVRDIFDLAMAGDIDTPTALDFASAYRNETSYAVWSEFATGLANIGSLTAGEPYHRAYENYCRGIFEPMVKKVGWKRKPNDSHSEILLRSLILANAGKYGEESVVEKSHVMFKSVTKGKNPIPADLRSVVYLTVARHGGEEEYKKMQSMHEWATLTEEKNRIAGALGRFPQKELIETTLVFAVSSKVRTQDTMRILGSVLSSKNGRDLGWKFIKKEWPLFLGRYGGAKSLSSLVSCLGVFADARHADEIETFFKKNPAPGATRTVEQVLERIRTKAMWLARDKKKIAKWISGRQND
ncbi:MAG: M1 family metallopeptidase, partial [Minisyncoccia bacterium]